MKKKSIKAWCLMEDGEFIAYYVTLFQMFFTKKDAVFMQKYYNGFPFNHNYKVVEVEIKVKTT